MSKISVVIRCFNEAKHIGRLLKWIKKQSETDVEVIVVDSGSTDGTVKMAESFGVKLVSIQPKDFSFGRSLNVGIKVASGKFIVMASAHVYPTSKHWLREMIAPFEDKKVALVYGKQRGAKTTKFSEHQVFKVWFPDKSDFEQTEPFCNNANAAIRRSLWKKYQYDEFLSVLEDLDWAKRVTSDGHLVAYNAKAKVIHIHEESYWQIYNRYMREAIAFHRIFPNEQMSFGEFVRLVFLNVISDVKVAYARQELWYNLPTIFLFRVMQFRGTYMGYQYKGKLTKVLRKRFYYPSDE